MIETKHLDSMLAEVQAEPAEGALRDLETYAQWVRLKPETLEAVEGLIARYRRRNSIVHTLARALADTAAIIDVLLEDGYPSLPVGDVPAAAARDMDESFAILSRGREEFDRARLPGGTKALGGLRDISSGCEAPAPDEERF